MLYILCVINLKQEIYLKETNGAILVFQEREICLLSELQIRCNVIGYLLSFTTKCDLDF